MNQKLLNFYVLMFLIALQVTSCSTKKEILYFQDVAEYKETNVNYNTNTLQPNDIVQVIISSALPESAVPYNRIQLNGNGAAGTMMNPQAANLQGYLVSPEGYITLPILGKIKVQGQTTTFLEEQLVDLLEEGKHLVDPSVSVRLVNGKVTVLGEVNNPGTFNFTEQNLSVLQALGLAGDLTINGKRDDIFLIRELDGIRRITHIDLTTVEWMADPEFSKVRPNDILVVQPNEARIKSAGLIGNVGTLLSVATTILSITILLTR